jgi:hypothetical protein
MVKFSLDCWVLKPFKAGIEDDPDIPKKFIKSSVAPILWLIPSTEECVLTYLAKASIKNSISSLSSHMNI